MAAYKDVDVDEELEFFLYVTINKTETKIDDASGKKYTVYLLEVQTNNNEWTIKKRYRQFDTLYCELEEAYPERPMPEFPVKTFWGEMDRKVIEKRRNVFEKFIRSVISDPFMNRADALLRFLEVEKHK